MSQFRWYLFQLGTAAAFMVGAYFLSRGAPDQSDFLIAMALFAFFLVCFANRWATIYMGGVMRRREGLPFVDRGKLKAWITRNSLWWLATSGVALGLASLKGFHLDTVIYAFVVAIALQVLARTALAIVYFRERPATLRRRADLAEEADHDGDALGRAWTALDEPAEVIEVPGREQPRKLLRPPS